MSPRRATPLSPGSRASKKLVDQDSHEDSHDVRGTADYLKRHHDENLRVGSNKKNLKDPNKKEIYSPRIKRDVQEGKLKSPRGQTSPGKFAKGSVRERP